MQMIEDTVDRTQSIGGSDVAAVLGLHPWKSPVDVYLEKTARVVDDEESEPAYWGKRLEGLVADEWAQRTGHAVRRVNRTLRHRDHSLLTAHIDRKVLRHSALLECKTAGAFVADGWGPSGTDEVPDYYLTQVLHYLEVTGYRWAAVGALIGGQEFRTYTIGADRDLQQRMVDECLRWWEVHVENDVPPAPRNPAEAGRLFPRARLDSQVEAGPDTEGLVTDLKTATAARKEAQKREDELKAQVLDRMEDSERLVAADGRTRAPWKAPAPSRSVDGTARKAGDPAVAEKYSVERSGSRRFLVK